MNELEEYVAARRQELIDERAKLRDGLSGSGGFTSPRAAQFMMDLRTRELLLDELERYGRFTEAAGEPVAETPEGRRPGRPRKAAG